MKRSAALIALLALAPPGRVVAASPPDYVATFAQEASGCCGPPIVSIVQHKGRFRSDVVSKDVVLSDYDAPGQFTRVLVARLRSGALYSLHLDWANIPETPALADRTPTAEHRTFMGEACRVWEASQARFVQRGCTTADGIDLWRKDGTVRELTVTQLTRRHVPASAVTPPLHLLDPRVWVSRGQRAQPTDSEGAEVVLRPDDFRRGPLIVRRSGAWLSVQQGRPASVDYTFTLSNSVERLSYSFYRTEKGAGHLSIQKARPGDEDEAGAPPAWIDGPGDETVLGEACRWVNPTPNIVTSESGIRECRTRDGLPLKVFLRRRGSETEYTAVTLHRGKVPLADVMPPPGPAGLSAWGLPHPVAR
jgi:hypothetical protein